MFDASLASVWTKGLFLNKEVVETMKVITALAKAQPRGLLVLNKAKAVRLMRRRQN